MYQMWNFLGGMVQGICFNLKRYSQKLGLYRLCSTCWRNLYYVDVATTVECKLLLFSLYLWWKYRDAFGRVDLYDLQLSIQEGADLGGERVYHLMYIGWKTFMGGCGIKAVYYRSKKRCNSWGGGMCFGVKDLLWGKCSERWTGGYSKTWLDWESSRDDIGRNYMTQPSQRGVEILLE